MLYLTRDGAAMVIFFLGGPADIPTVQCCRIELGVGSIQTIRFGLSVPTNQ
jgi:hypothetical protein